MSRSLFVVAAFAVTVVLAPTGYRRGQPTFPEVLDALPPLFRDGIELTVDRDDASRDFVLQCRSESAQ